MTLSVAPGWALVQMVSGDYQTASGLVVAGSSGDLQRGKIVAFGEPEPTVTGTVIEFPFYEDDVAFFRKGVEFTHPALEGKHQLVYRNDILAVESAED